MKVKEGSEKVDLKLNIQKTKIMASGPITSWEIDRETMETVRDFILWGSKITADGKHSHEIKRCFLLGRKAMINLSVVGLTVDGSKVRCYEVLYCIGTWNIRSMNQNWKWSKRRWQE